MTVALVVFLAPLAAAVLSVLFGRAAAWLASAGALASGVAGAAVLARTARGASWEASVEWLPGLSVSLSVTALTALLGVMVATVAFFVLVYAVGYMAGEPERVRFFASMSLFLAAMQALVLSGDWLLFLVAWEVMALASYLLIGHWHESGDARDAASRAFVTTRTADIGLYLAVFLLVTATGTASMAAAAPVGVATALAGLLMLVAAAAKAAQVPFQGWLAAAMAGPTPVSALLHSATLVAAGVLLMVRAFPLLPPGALLVVGLLGGITTVVAGLTAVAQLDLKRLLAASTSSQLGLMLLALGAGSVAAAVFHLIAHAAMKSTLFLATGVFQRDRGSTAFRDLGGAGRVKRPAYLAFAVAGLALAGVPPLSGFWSKDAVLAAALASADAGLLVPLAFAGSLLTGTYVARALRLLWRGEAAAPGPRAGQAAARSDAGGGWMRAGLLVLGISAAAAGLLAGPLQELTAMPLPGGWGAVAMGLAAATLGLMAGWLLPARRLLGGLLPWAERGFQVGGGLAAFIVRPTQRLATAISGLDRALHSLVGGAARSALALAARVSAADVHLHRRVEGAAAGVLTAAHLVQATDRDGIEALIAALARSTRELGWAGRHLQSGLVHRYLALTVAGTAALALLLVTLVVFV